MLAFVQHFHGPVLLKEEEYDDDDDGEREDALALGPSFPVPLREVQEGWEHKQKKIGGWTRMEDVGKIAIPHFCLDSSGKN